MEQTPVPGRYWRSFGGGLSPSHVKCRFLSFGFLATSRIPAPLPHRPRCFCLFLLLPANNHGTSLTRQSRRAHGKTKRIIAGSHHSHGHCGPGARTMLKHESQNTLGQTTPNSTRVSVRAALSGELHKTATVGDCWQSSASGPQKK
jgi:hypothetical protein